MAGTRLGRSLAELGLIEANRLYLHPSSTTPSEPLDESALTRLDEIFPGYRTAPEHYAW